MTEKYAVQVDAIEPCPGCAIRHAHILPHKAGRRVVCICGYIGPWGASVAEAMTLWDNEALSNVQSTVRVGQDREVS